MMNDKELKRNGSGYIDEPCYKAVTAPPRPGEIYIHAKSGAQMLVLANVNGICPTLKLSDWDEEGAVPVTSRTKMYVKPSMIGYCFENLLTTFVKSVKGNEMKEVRKGVIRALGLFDEVTQDNPMPEEYKALQDEIDGLRAQLAEAKATAAVIPHDHINALEEKVRVLEKENLELIQQRMAGNANVLSDTINCLKQENLQLTIYKDMYMDLIGKLVSAKVGAVNE